MHSERIKEFLKYASPRLDYIEHCMEKKAISAATIARAAKKAQDLKWLQSRLSKGKLDRLGGAITRSKAGDTRVLYTDPNTGLTRMVVDSQDGVGQKFLIDPKTGAANRVVRPADPKQGPTADPKPTPKGDKPDGETKGWWDDFSKGVGDWAKEHPVLTPAITAGVAAPITGGIGYGIGRDSGFESGSSNAAAYWQMREALRNHQLRGVNSEFLTRLANLFGGGDLSRLIG